MDEEDDIHNLVDASSLQRSTKEAEAAQQSWEDGGVAPTELPSISPRKERDYDHHYDSDSSVEAGIPTRRIHIDVDATWNKDIAEGLDSPVGIGKDHEILFPEEDILAGCTVADFDYMQMLGEGGFGDVFRVRHKVSKEHYAMKIIKQEGVLRGHDMSEEALIMDELRHPFIIRKVTSFVPQGFSDMTCLIMELVKGGTWEKVMIERRFNQSKRRRRPIDEDICVYYGAELVLALEYMHSKKMIYRDLKPDNFMLREDGHICLIDFGAASVLDDDKHRRAKTKIGADGFKAPEMLDRQYRRKEGYGVAVDWWNLGLNLYMMLSAKHPFLSKKMSQSLDEEVIKRQPVVKNGARKREASPDSEGSRRSSASLNLTHAGSAKPSGLARLRSNTLDKMRRFGKKRDPGDLKPIKRVSEAANHLVRLLLNPDPLERLDCAKHIKTHPFFHDVDWHAMASRAVPPPDVHRLTKHEHVLNTSDMERPRFRHFSHVLRTLERGRKDY